VVVGMDRCLAACELNRPVGDHLVGVHIRLRAGAGLKDAERELIVECTVDDFLSGAGDEIDLLQRQLAEFAVGECGAFLDDPHRGIETITYVLAGTVEHGDSMGNRGAIGAGDIQWMTAGRGIIHQEMPKGDPGGRMHGFQLWANLPAKLKMTAPRYQEVKAVEIPEVTDDDGTMARIVCGSFWGKKGPVDGI